MKQEDIIFAIDCQKMIVRDRPYDVNERLVLDALYVSLRKTFRLVPSTPERGHITPSQQYTYSGPILKPR